MSIVFDCPACGRQVKSADEHAGKSVRCPKCKDAIRVPAAEPPPSQAVVTYSLPNPYKEMPLTEPPPARLPTVVPGPMRELVPAREEKPCPFCGEHVLSAAKKCKHCGETIDVTLRAAEELQRAAQQQAQPQAIYITNTSESTAIAKAKSKATSSPLVGCFALILSLLSLWLCMGGGVPTGHKEVPKQTPPPPAEQSK